MSTPYHESHYEVWQHRRSGEVWAVELTDGKVAKVCGPIEERDFSPAIIEYLPARQEDEARDLDRRRNEFIRDPLGLGRLSNG
jgi:hypothetical protein